MTKPQTGRRSTKGGGLPRASGIDQEELFPPKRGAGDVGPATHRSHPLTSEHAARKAADKLTTKQLAVLDVFQRAFDASGASAQQWYPGAALMTHEQVVREYHERITAPVRSWYPDITDSSIRTRVKELATLGYVEKYDELGKSDRGNASSRWTPTAAGVLVDVVRIRNGA